MADDLTKLWGKISLSKEESEDVEINNCALTGVLNKGHLCLVGKLVADLTVSKAIIRTTLLRGWKPTRELSFKVLGDNLFLLDFENEWDKIRVLEGRPWVFEGNLFFVEEFDGLTPPNQIDFEQVIFWVRMFGLLLACMSQAVGATIGATVRVVEEVDTDDEGIGWGEFLRVRIRMDLSKPLARGRSLKLFGKTVWVTFKYERLPRICFHCGVIRHGKHSCLERPSFRVQGATTEFGPWMRVPSPTRRTDPNRGRWEEKGEQRQYCPSGSGSEGRWKNSRSYNQGDSEHFSGDMDTSGGGNRNTPTVHDGDREAVTAKVIVRTPYGNSGGICGSEEVGGGFFWKGNVFEGYRQR